MRILVVFALCLAVTAGLKSNPQKNIRNSLITIDQRPTIVSLLYSADGQTRRHACTGTIINWLSILTTAHCTIGDAPNRWRVRFASSYANLAGTTTEAESIIIHPSYNEWTLDNDLSIIRTPRYMYIAGAPIAGSNYNLHDNVVLHAAGWGITTPGADVLSEQLREIQVLTVNQERCRNRYAEVGRFVTDNMLCSGWFDIGGNDQCLGDSGGPLYHNDVVIGVFSWSFSCTLPAYPGVYARLSRFTAWIQNNA